MTLREQQVEFARLVPRLIDRAFSLGFDVVLGETYRTPEQAALNAAKGTGIRNSLHCDRLAIDLILFDGDRWLQQSAAYEPLGSWWESQSTGELNCCWGGRFSRPDGGHFSTERNGVR